jgi:hypothetical protein
MLTEKAHYERKWNWIPRLAQLLSTKQIPEHYFGVASTSDNRFDRVRRLMEISILIQENHGELKSQISKCEQSEKTQIEKELRLVSSALESIGKEFITQSHELLLDVF